MQLGMKFIRKPNVLGGLAMEPVRWLMQVKQFRELPRRAEAAAADGGSSAD